MALTSHRRAMKLLGRNWKRLHRMVYYRGSFGRIAQHQRHAVLGEDPLLRRRLPGNPDIRATDRPALAVAIGPGSTTGRASAENA